VSCPAGGGILPVMASDGLPRLEELPHGEGGYDRDAVASAFSAFQRRIGELEGTVAALGPVVSELRALRAGVASDAADWSPGNGSGLGAHPGVVPPPPLPRPVIVPRLVLEAAFLAAVAAVAAVAKLDAVWIVAVMAGAWVLVALSEWAAFLRQRRWRLDEVAPLITQTAPDPAWFVPPVEATMLELSESSESQTVIARLPAGEETVAHAPPLELDDEPEPGGRRRRLWRRREPAEAAAEDPWEA